jgi:methionyl-tRNA synthetase
MAEKYFEGRIERPDLYIAKDFADECAGELNLALDDGADTYWSHLRLNAILEHIWNIVRATNNHIARTEPWKLAKSDPAALKTIIFEIWNALRITALSIYPFMPSTAESMWKQIGLRSLTEDAVQNRSCIFAWEWNPSHEIKVAKGDQLFPRIEKGNKVQKQHGTGTEKEKPKMTEQPPVALNELIGIEDFAKIELKIGTVTAAERVEKSEKLIKLKVDIGEERQIVAGIGKAYTPEDLIGKKIVVLANLKPAKLMGVESRGMLLAATDSEGTLSVLTPERDVKTGAKIK